MRSWRSRGKRAGSTEASSALALRASTAKSMPGALAFAMLRTRLARPDAPVTDWSEPGWRGAGVVHNVALLR